MRWLNWICHITHDQASRRVIGGELAGGRWLVVVSTQSAGAPIIDGCSSHTVDQDTGEHRWYTGVLIRPRPTMGRGLVICSRGAGPKWLWIGRVVPWALIGPRPQGQWFAPRRRTTATIARQRDVEQWADQCRRDGTVATGGVRVYDDEASS